MKFLNILALSILFGISCSKLNYEVLSDTKYHIIVTDKTIIEQYNKQYFYYEVLDSDSAYWHIKTNENFEIGDTLSIKKKK